MEFDLKSLMRLNRNKLIIDCDEMKPRTKKKRKYYNYMRDTYDVIHEQQMKKKRYQNRDDPQALIHTQLLLVLLFI